MAVLPLVALAQGSSPAEANAGSSTNLLNALRETTRREEAAREGLFPSLLEQLEKPASRLDVADGSIEWLFSYPVASNISARIVEQIEAAKAEILISSYALSDEKVIYSLIRAKSLRGLRVMAILEPTPPIRNYGVPSILIENGVLTFYCNSTGRNNIDYVITDRSTVISGYRCLQSSLNDAAQAQLIQSPSLARIYVRQFLEHLNSSVIPEVQLIRYPTLAADLPKILFPQLSQ